MLVVWVQTSDAAEVEAIKAGVAVLKRVCRQRTTVAWKDWRHSVEEQKRVALQVAPSFFLLPPDFSFHLSSFLFPSFFLCRRMFDGSAETFSVWLQRSPAPVSHACMYYRLSMN